jgi:hypothetical protein
MTPKKFDRLLPKLLLATVGVLLIMSPYVWAERGVVLRIEKTDTYYPEKRVALVIGNSKYQEKPLQNATNDAKDMAKTLHKYGFTVILKQNLDQEAMDQAIDEFEQRIDKHGISLISLFQICLKKTTDEETTDKEPMSASMN